MSVRKLTAKIFGSLVMLCGMASAQAQEHVPPADPFAFDPDWRWFEPIYDMDLADMKPKHRANTGWFATYDRLNLYGSRPELADPNHGETKMDSGWGHRYEIGYMLPDEDNGWLFSWVDADVGQFFTVRRERLNRANLDELDGGATNPAPPFGFEAIPGDANNIGYNRRFIDIQDTENVFDFDSYELSKTWRLEPYHYGGILEPMIGIRWFRIEDLNARQTLISSSDPPLIPGGDPPLIDIYGSAAEQLTTAQARTDNEAITGQIGFRYTKFRDRFMFSSDFRVFSGANFQCSRTNTTQEITVYQDDDPAIGDDVERIINYGTEPIYTRNEEFLLGFDVRGEIAYQLTRSISIRGGFQLIDVADGLWRGGPLDFRNPVAGGDNDQDLLLFGATFGLTLNR
ncbi:hypothetical protein FYK55_04625 [Roseiconus nitratireducens]|uniref:Uncharacterized protein n=1 Tax=Roseiconus nitratireducens TaxID=2605748 RepID=A0A5M6DIW5_9BACT|nr:hypothetical protein [Roseiconus nitratireducens]KAA5546182.1 hypothetical protein FYK55_04625 [Roseiconus nitratireducens]